MSLLEVVVALALMMVLFGMVFSLLGSTQRVEARTVVVADIRAKTQLCLERIARELRDSAESTYAARPAPPVGASELEWKRVTGFTASGPVFGPVVRIGLADEPGEDPGNDADDDGDGLIDERQVVRVEDPGGLAERTTILAVGVPRMCDGELLGNGRDDDGDGLSDEGADGIDDDGNGLIDDGGLSFTFEEAINLVSVRVTLARRTSKDEITFTMVETKVWVRN